MIYIKLSLITSLSLFMVPLTVLSSEGLYEGWESVLKQHVKNGSIDYSSLLKSKDPLNYFFENVKNLPRQEYDRWSNEEKIAFWINVYNASAVKLILDHYPLKKRFGIKALVFPKNSIQQIPNVWKRETVDIFEKEFSLHQIEHQILRKEFKEPRIHMALVCASKGCPSLRSEAYQGEKLDEQLNDQTRNFLTQNEKAHYDEKTDRLYLSPIFKWFREDFERTEGFLSFLKKYLPKDVTEKISDKTKIKWLSYDWSLNERSS